MTKAKEELSRSKNKKEKTMRFFYSLKKKHETQKTKCIERFNGNKKMKKRQMKGNLQ